MLNFNRTRFVGFISGFIFLAGSNSFAQLSCESQWVTNEGPAHCHVSILKKGTRDKIGACLKAAPFLVLDQQDTCEQFCRDTKHPEVQEQLIDFLFKANLALGKQSDQLVNGIKKLKGDLALTNQIAGNACVKAEKLKMILQVVSSKTGLKLDLGLGDGEEGDDEEDEGEATVRKNKSDSEPPAGMYN